MEMKAGGAEKNQEGMKTRWLKLKNPAEIWRNHRQQNQSHTAEDECVGEEQQEQLEEVSRRLILREEQLFSQAAVSEEEEDRLQCDLEALRLKMWTAVSDTFCSPQGLLRSAVASIQQQEEQDLRWASTQQEEQDLRRASTQQEEQDLRWASTQQEEEQDLRRASTQQEEQLLQRRRSPAWRPLRCWSSHHRLLHSLVEARLTRSPQEEEEEAGGAPGLSTPLKRQVCWMGGRVKEDLLVVGRSVRACYPPAVDILGLYAGLYHRAFSLRLAPLAAAGLQPEDRGYLLLWTNHCYPRDVLGHEDLRDIKTLSLGPLLPLDQLDHLEDQHLDHKEGQVKQWLDGLLRKEEDSWLSGQKPELIGQHHFSPLAVDVIQVIDGALAEFRCVIRDQRKGQRITAHLDSFLSSYKKRLEDFVKGNHGNVHSVIKAQLFCEQQLRCYITGQTGSVWEQRGRCLSSLSALRDCGYRCLTCPLHSQLKVALSELWTPAWLDGSLPVVDALLDSLSKHLDELTHLETTCRQALLCVLYEQVVLQYVRMMLTTKVRMKSRQQQEDAAQRMDEDNHKMADFFREEGCSESRWLSEVVGLLAEVLRLQDPGSVQLEVVSLSRKFPDLSDVHVSALLALKASLSSADVRCIGRSVKELRPPDGSANHSPAFFSKVKMKKISKPNLLVQKARALSAR